MFALRKFAARAPPVSFVVIVERFPRNSLKFALFLRVFWRFSFSAVRNLFELRFWPVFMGVFEAQGITPRGSQPLLRHTSPGAFPVVELSVAAAGSGCALRN